MISSSEFLTLRNSILIILMIFLAACGSEEEVSFPPANCVAAQTLEIESGVMFQIPNDMLSEINQEVSSAFSSYSFKSEGNAFIAPFVDMKVTKTFGQTKECPNGVFIVDIIPTKITDNGVALAPYPLESGNISRFDSLTKDENNVPLYTSSSGSQSYFHILISKAAQVYYAKIYSGVYAEEDYLTMINIADWLSNNCIQVEDKFCVWKSSTPFTAYKLPPDWTSAMAQGQAISALISIYSITGQKLYLETALKAMPAFHYDIAQGGVAADFDGAVWFEEFGSIEQPAHVLNGFIFGLTSLAHANEYIDTKLGNQIFQIGLDSLKQKISLYDFKFTTRYDYSPLEQLASTKGRPGDGYHELHITQLAYLSNLSNEDFLLDYAKKFLLYDTGGFDSIYRWRNKGKKILSIETNFPLEGQNIGALTDSVWEWGEVVDVRSDKLEMKVKLNNQGSSDSSILGLRITSSISPYSPVKITLEGCYSGDTPLILDRNDADTQYIHTSPKAHQSITHVYRFEMQINSDCVNVTLFATQEQRLVIREFSLFLEQNDFLSELREAFRPTN